jgi:hypothetical protein
MRTSIKNKAVSSNSNPNPSPATAPAQPAPEAPPTAPPPVPATSAGTPQLPANPALIAFVNQAIVQLDAAETALAVDPPALTSSQKRRAAKLRAGGDKAVGQIALLAKQYGVESSVLRADTMSLALADAQALAPLMLRIQDFQKHVSDLLFLWQSAAWDDAMQFYALLQRRALVNGALADALAPVAAFFAKRHASTKAGKTPKRTAKANAKAVNRLKKAAPELLALGATATGTAAATSAAPPSPAAAPAAPPAPAPTNGAGPAAHS